MTAWWEGLSLLQKVFASTAIPATVLLVLQTVMLIFGLAQGDADADFDADSDADFDTDFDTDTDVDGDFDGDHGHGHGHTHSHGTRDSGLRVFSVRAFVAFFSVFGWLGLALSEGGLVSSLSLVFATLAGLAAMIIMAWLMRAMLKLQQTGNQNIGNAVGKSGTVYIPIPANRSGVGKVTLVVDGRFSEVEAVTDSDTPLKTGSSVTVVSVGSQNIVCVIPQK
ncbi:MAG: hypothetical protein FWE69_06185 [Clostridiales bacterium]|nr:hypothetical protein [Clostridiales bacterium]